MIPAGDCFGPIDFRLTTAGVRLYTSSPLATWLNRLGKLLFLFTYWNAIVSMSFMRFDEDKLADFAVSLYYVFSILYQVTIYSRRDDLRSLNDDIVAYLTNESRARVKAFAVRALILVVCADASNSLGVIPYFIKQDSRVLFAEQWSLRVPTERQSYHTALAALYWFLLQPLLTNWTYILVGIYVYFLHLLFQLDSHYFRTLISGLEKEPGNGWCKRQLLWRMKLDEIKFRFENTLNFIPLILFSYIFFSTSGTVLNLVNQKLTISENYFKISEIVDFCVDFSAMFLIIFFKVRFEKKISAQVESVTQLILRNQALIDTYKFELLAKFESEGAEYKLTAWGLFELNETLTLSFVGSLFSFSVLFIQLSR